MFERFTRDARAAVIEAVEVAESAKATRVGRSHLLIGLAATSEPTLRASGLTAANLGEALVRRSEAGDAADAEALSAIGIDLDTIRERAEASFGPGAWDAGDPAKRRRSGFLGRLLASDRQPFSAGARKALELGLREALADRSREISPTHLLRGLLRDPGPEATALIESVLPLAELRSRVARPPAA